MRGGRARDQSGFLPRRAVVRATGQARPSPLAPHPVYFFSLCANAFLNFESFGATTYAQYGCRPLRAK